MVCMIVPSTRFFFLCLSLPDQRSESVYFATAVQVSFPSVLSIKRNPSTLPPYVLSELGLSLLCYVGNGDLLRALYIRYFCGT